MTQHQDPLVYNANTGEWQNASNPYSGGVPLGLSIGDPVGSIVSLTPASGTTISIDGGPPLPIQSAFTVASGAASENTAGFQASIVNHPGAANEQLGHLTVSGLNASSAQAVLMFSESNDGSIHGSVKHGTISPGTGGTTFKFVTMHSYFPHSQVMQVGTGSQLNWGIYATDQGGSGAAETWNPLGSFGNNPGFKNGWSSNLAGEYLAAVRYSPLHDGVLFFRGCLITPPTGTNVNSTQVCSAFPTNYRPKNNARMHVASLTTAGSMGYAVLDTSGVFLFRGLPATNGASIDITGHMHIG